MTRSPRSFPERRGRRLLPPSLLLLAGVLLGLPGLAPAGAQFPAGAGEARAKAKAALADSRFQRILPDHAPTEAQQAPRERGASFGGSGGPALLPVLGAGALLAKSIFVVLLLVAVALIVGWSIQAIARRRGRPESAASGSAAVETSAVPERDLVYDDAARLAAEGRYAEAVHALLIAAIRHFAERSRTAVQPSRTSRELVKLLPLGPDARAAFADLVRTVELSLFGGAPVGAEDYERNLERFRALTRRPA